MEKLRPRRIWQSGVRESPGFGLEWSRAVRGCRAVFLGYVCPSGALVGCGGRGAGSVVQGSLHNPRSCPPLFGYCGHISTGFRQVVVIKSRGRGLLTPNLMPPGWAAREGAPNSDKLPVQGCG